MFKTFQDNSLIYFAQCDTTAGLLSYNKKYLNEIKLRKKSQNVLLQVASLKILKTYVRIPKKHKNRIRKATKCTFIYPNKQAIRVVNKGLHYQFFAPFQSLYSTSANPTKQDFNRQWAENICDVIICDKRGFAQKNPSKIYKINHSRIQRRR